jgi:chlorophyll synthase
MGIHSLPVLLGPARAARVACWVMALPQLAVMILLLDWGAAAHAAAVALLLVAQGLLMQRFVAEPERRAVWYSGLGVTLYVAGMLISAFALQGLARAAA